MSALPNQISKQDCRQHVDLVEAFVVEIPYKVDSGPGDNIYLSDFCNLLMRSLCYIL